MKKYNITKKFLIKEYAKKEKSQKQIAKEIGCSISPIYDRLLEYKILIRTMSEVKKDNTGNKNGNYNPEKHKKHFCIEKDCNNEISYWNWLYGSRRCRSCSIKNLWENDKFRNKLIGENASGYIDGLSRFPYPLEWTETLKESIRQRDNYTCQKCGIIEEELIGRFKKLDVHHIDYNKENLNPNNLAALCRKCNTIVNFNRDYWFAYFTHIMEGYYVR